MGIVDLWDIISDSDAQLGRYSLSQFVVDHYRQHPSPPKIAVDGNLLLLGSTNSSVAAELQDRVTIGNFTAKLLALSALGITYVVVFDGIYKPYKLRHGDDQTVTQLSDYDQLRSMYLSHDAPGASERSLGETGYPLMAQTIVQLQSLGIQYIFCPGEAEAQCAYFQQEGLVDYVITNDSDCFAFGATKVLRNMLREESNDEYSITFFDITKHQSLNRNTLIYLVSLRGGDYSEGVRSLGSKRSAALANASPHWTDRFIHCFLDQEGEIRDPKVRESLVSRFSDELLRHIQKHAKDIFGMNFIPKLLNLSLNFPLFYLKPLVLENGIEFSPNCLSNAEIEDERHFHLSSKLSNYPIKYLVIKLIQLSSVQMHLQVTREKLIGLIPSLMIKYDEDKIRECLDIPKRSRSPTRKADLQSIPPSPSKDLTSATTSPLKSPNRGNYVWLPRVITHFFNKDMVSKYEKQKSPNKQSTTLDLFKQFSPSKRDKQEFDLMGSMPKLTHTRSDLSYSPTKKRQTQPIFSNFSSPTRSPRKRAKKGQILPGQKSVDTFFNKLIYSPTTTALNVNANEDEASAPASRGDPVEYLTTHVLSTKTYQTQTETGVVLDTATEEDNPFFDSSQSTKSTGTHHTYSTAITAISGGPDQIINLISSEADGTISQEHEQEPSIERAKESPTKALKTVSITESLLDWTEEGLSP